ncbi:hypothetical protein [Arthrobacter caoxuetaonis]|uniref:Uncharacterized protein n=1 Tax=Arthrobacter caoxuetaonis TaxID=2886935 RepID=A0A9X1MB90_9MICC|nr:hypothetical protein [Arthrobacter caoxuetaonis]MCC3296556.1 hypothetical protein [Arthrobacter caoxuetaonis]USQ56614.1 hypothetical protein NF551_12785 [Arthrobacter caoxuetaonis]
MPTDTEKFCLILHTSSRRATRLDAGMPGWRVRPPAFRPALLLSLLLPVEVLRPLLLPPVLRVPHLPGNTVRSRNLVPGQPSALLLPRFPRRTLQLSTLHLPGSSPCRPNLSCRCRR